MGSFGDGNSCDLKREIAVEDVKHIAVGDIVKFVSTEQTQKGIVLSFIEDHSFFNTKVLWENGKMTYELAFSLMRMDGPDPILPSSYDLDLK